MIVELLAGDDRTWALAERICEASVAAEEKSTDEALRLARLASWLDSARRLQKPPA